MMGIFISYRRDDSAASAGRLYDRLVDHFGKERVFRDLDAIVPGAEFATVIEARISQSKVLIAVIGKDWLNAKNEQGQRRLDAPNDLVRAEIREALNQKKWVIPVLVEGASIPNAPALPSDIAALAQRNAIDISESRFNYDAGELIKAIKAVVSTPPDGSAGGQRPWAWLSDANHQRTVAFIGAGIATIIGGAWTAYLHFAEDRKAEVPTIVVGPKPEPTNLRSPVSVEQKGVEGNGNVVSGVNTGAISVTAEGDHKKDNEPQAPPKDAAAKLAQPQTNAVTVEQENVQGNGNVASGVNTGTISVTVTREHRQNKEQK